MSGPVRLQLSRRKGFDLQQQSLATNGLPAVNVARPSKWGNPYKIGERTFNPATGGHPICTPEIAVEKFRLRLTNGEKAGAVTHLRGRNLACWCALDAPCHADVLLDIANHPICERVP